MNRLLSPKMVWSSMTAVSIALLSGCSNLQSATAPANASEFTNVGAAAPLALPDAARLRISATEALSGQGMYYFDDDKAARLYIAQDKSSKDRFLVKESFDQGVPHGLPWGTGAQALVYDGVAVKPENILSATPNRDGSLSITYGDHPNMKINMKLEAFDVSGMFVRDFLRTRGNQPTLSASFVSPERKFLAGSVAYAMTLWVDQDEVLVPNLKGFTGANSIEDFSKRFAGNTPYCLRFLPGNIVQPMGMGFKEPIKGKITKVKGKSVEEEQSGRVSLYAAKKNTVFCSRERNYELTVITSPPVWRKCSFRKVRRRSPVLCQFTFGTRVPRCVIASIALTKPPLRSLKSLWLKPLRFARSGNSLTKTTCFVALRQSMPPTLRRSFPRRPFLLKTARLAPLCRRK